MLNQTKTIVFIHGLFTKGESWDNWVTFFESEGFKCYTPSYPYREGKVADLRKQLHPKLKNLNFSQVRDSLVEFIKTLPEKPIVIGHSMGGLLVQKMVEMDLAVAGIAICSSPPKGIFSFEWSFLKNAFPIINPFKGNQPFLPSVRWFQRALCNHLSLEQAQIEYDSKVIPDSRNIAREIVLTKQGKINFKISHKPILIIAAEKDTIIPASLNWKNFEAYLKYNPKVSFKIFTNRTHFILKQEGWEDVALHVKEWIKNAD